MLEVLDPTSWNITSGRQVIGDTSGGRKETLRMLSKCSEFMMGFKKNGSTSQVGKRRLPLTLLTVWTCACVCLSMAAPALAGQPLLKPDVPKFDTATEAPAVAPSRDANRRAPLRGQIEHSEKAGVQQRGLRGGAQGGSLGGLQRGTADSHRLRGKAGNDLLQAEAESGIGIIGVKFVMFNGRPPVINRVFPGTPAMSKGLRIDDIILAVDGVPTHGLTKEEVYDLIVGTPRTPVTLSVVRKGEFIVVTMNRMDLNDITDPFVRKDYMMSM